MVPLLLKEEEEKHMPHVQLDLVWTVFVIFCGYSLYTPFVSFMWAEKGQRVFQNLKKVPIIVFVYFLVPCVALFLLNKAYSGVQQPALTFVLASAFILGISFVVMLYILTVPTWPIGKFLQIDRLPVSLIRTLVSINAGGSLLVAIVCGIIIVQTPRALQRQGQQDTVTRLEAQNQQLEREKAKSTGSISGIRADAIRKVIDDDVKSAQGIVGLFGSVVTVWGSVLVLRGKKNHRERTGSNERT